MALRGRISGFSMNLAPQGYWEWRIVWADPENEPVRGEAPSYRKAMRDVLKFVKANATNA